MDSHQPTTDPAPLRPEQLTWSVLIGRWVAFARSAVALPTDAEGRRLRDSVPDIINLQAVWFALEHLDDLSQEQRALGLDRAAVLIERHRGLIESRWTGKPLPDGLRSLIDDAEASLEQQRDAHSSP